MLTHDEHEFLAGLNGDRILQAMNSKRLSSLSARLCKELEHYSFEHSELNIHTRPSDKLYDILKHQATDRKGWFHLIHQRYKHQQDAIAEIKQLANLEMQRALAEQKRDLEVHHERRMKTLFAQDRQIVRGG